MSKISKTLLVLALSISCGNSANYDDIFNNQDSYYNEPLFYNEDYSNNSMESWFHNEYDSNDNERISNNIDEKDKNTSLGKKRFSDNVLLIDKQNNIVICNNKKNIGIQTNKNLLDNSKEQNEVIQLKNSLLENNEEFIPNNILKNPNNNDDKLSIKAQIDEIIKLIAPDSQKEENQEVISLLRNLQGEKYKQVILKIQDIIGKDYSTYKNKQKGIRSNWDNVICEIIKCSHSGYKHLVNYEIKYNIGPTFNKYRKAYRPIYQALVAHHKNTK